MKGRILTVVLVSLLLAAAATVVWADKPIGTDEHGNEIAWQATNCTKIQSGEIVGSDGSVVTVGYNEWGYNYQGHMFNGMWCEYHPIYRPGGAYHEWCVENYGDVHLMMKWNDAWLANVDCEPDTELDRHYGFASYKGSGAWLTNHMRGEGTAADDWTYFVEIVAVPTDAYVSEPWYTDGQSTWGTYYTVDGIMIGEEIWGDFAITQQVESGTGATWVSPAGTGLGNW